MKPVQAIAVLVLIALTASITAAAEVQSTNSVSSSSTLRGSVTPVSDDSVQEKESSRVTVTYGQHFSVPGDATARARSEANINTGDTDDETGGGIGEEDLAKLQQQAAQQDLAVLEAAKYYVDNHAPEPKMQGIGNVEAFVQSMKRWAYNTFATRHRVQQLEQDVTRLQQQVAYLRHATNQSTVDAQTAAQIMANGNHSTFTYGGAECYVSQQYRNGTTNKRVYCVQ